jgi:hypothetical protein
MWGKDSPTNLQHDTPERINVGWWLGRTCWLFIFWNYEVFRCSPSHVASDVRRANELWTNSENALVGHKSIALLIDENIMKESWVILTPVRSPWTMSLECTIFNVSFARNTILVTHSTGELKQRRWAATNIKTCMCHIMKGSAHNLQLLNHGELLEITFKKHSKRAFAHPWGNYSRQRTKSFNCSQ